MVGSQGINALLELFDVSEPLVLFELAVEMLEVRLDVVCFLGLEVSEVHGGHWYGIGPKEDIGVDINVHSSVIALDTVVEWFIATVDDGILQVRVDQEVIKDLAASLIGTKVSDAMGIEEYIAQATFSAQSIHSSDTFPQYHIEVPSYADFLAFGLALLDKVDEVSGVVETNPFGVFAAI